jgi:TfoX/Sxy family transcriptional regulator of competence genes
MNPAEVVQALRRALAGSDVREIKMFGGTCFMLNGNMLAGTFRNGLLARVGAEAQSEALAQPGASIMEMRGRPMDGFVFVAPEALDSEAVGAWVGRARTFVETLPAKPQSAAKERKKR